jgi:probable H4MPT-linked C1 transfer pathway protein
MPRQEIFGWDIGGAHLKASRLQQGRVVDVAQWACPLWTGLQALEQVLVQAQQRWPQLDSALHAVTMTGEMVDGFEHREDGVRRIAALLAERLAEPTRLRFFAGDAGWCGPALVSAAWPAIASANWLATAMHTALLLPQGSALLVDIGSTTTDLIALRDGRVLTPVRSDAERLASGELVYQGVVRTPLCALARRIEWSGRHFNVMNEFFATTADVYRLCGELDPAHDLQPAADGGAKDLGATRQRLARMIGMDEREGSAGQWLAFAQAWRRCQLDELAGQMQRVLSGHGLGADTQIVSAGCGDFLMRELQLRCGLQRTLAYAIDIARLGSDRLSAWAQVCAPCVAVASLLDREQH